MSISQLRIDDDMLAASGGALPEDHSEQHACVQWLWWEGRFWWPVCLSRVDDVLKLSLCLWQARARRFAGAWVSGGGSA